MRDWIRHNLLWIALVWCWIIALIALSRVIA